MNDIVLAITGASGSAYAVRLLEVLLSAGRNVQLVISGAATIVLERELGRTVDLANFDLRQLAPEIPDDCTERVQHHGLNDFMAGIASGSYPTDGMVICPCSMGTLSSVAHGLSSNLIHRAADVHLKERRKLIVVPRETPLASIQLGNMKTLSDAGAVILPAMPGFYHNPESIGDLVDFVVNRICDQLGVEVDLTQRWGTEEHN